LRVLAPLALLLASGSALAQPVLITAPLTINPGATTITPTAGGAAVPLATAQITVEGTTLTMNGRHTIASLVLQRSAGNQPAILTHDANFSYDANPGPDVDLVNGLQLTTSGAVLVQGAAGPQVASRIDVSSRGFPSGQGPGMAGLTNQNGAGGSHGGQGGRATGTGFQLPADTYGSLTAPTTFGSGGSPSSSNGSGTAGAGAGGGAIVITASGPVTIDGQVLSNGGTGSTSWYASGGGAGGSIWIAAPSIAGIGQIAADGGAGSIAGYAGAGSGGGGRVRLSSTNTAGFTGTITASGGNLAPTNAGAPGPIVRTAPGSKIDIALINPVATLSLTPIDLASVQVRLLDVGANAVVNPRTLASIDQLITRDLGELRATAPIVATDMQVQTGGLVRHAGPLGSLQINTTTFNLASGGTISAVGAGHPSNTGPGAPGRTNGNAAGAGHGGLGGTVVGSFVAANPNGGASYGNPLSPTDFGSGGGASSSGANTDAGGGSGGGAIRIIANSATINGTIDASGTNGVTNWYDSGGGSGGSVWISTVGLVTGTGTIAARGGTTGTLYGSAGGGAGGRVSIISGSGSFTGTFDVSGGADAVPDREGASGTVYTKAGAAPGTLTFPAAIEANAAFTPLVVGLATDAVVIAPLARVLASGEFTSGPLTVQGNSLLQTRPLEALSLIVNGALNVDTGGRISADSAGFPSNQGPGTPGPTTGNGAGAGHGGRGGTVTATIAANPVGGPAYGDPLAPTTFGSGGGPSSSNGLVASGAGVGGGVIKITATTATINGAVTADGGNGVTSWYDSGGGSGGSVWIVASGAVSGSGLIGARGGAAGNLYTQAGGGAGGRVAVIAGSIPFSGSGAFDVSGGVDTVADREGGSGTIYTKVGSLGGIITIPAAVDATANPTPLQNWPIDVSVVALSGARLVANTATIGSLTLNSGAQLSADPVVPIDLEIGGNLVVNAGARITADGMGHRGGEGPGAPAPTSGDGNGGSFGGLGGVGNRPPARPAALAYGDPISTFLMGSGGGASSGNAGENNSGGRGGGAIRLDVAGFTVINGELSANGLSGFTSWYDSGGGSGGGIFLVTPTLSGSGTIRARGGNGLSLYASGGGGSGGRIAIFSCNQSFPLASIDTLGGPGFNPGAPGTVYTAGSSSLTILENPNPSQRAAGTVTLSAQATTTSGTVSYQWQRREPSGLFVNLGNNATFSGTTTSTLTIQAGCDESGFYHCLITDGCGSAPTNLAALTPPLEYDYNQDENVDLTDAQQMAQVAAGLISPDPSWLSGDVNNDENADLTDAQQLAAYIASGVCPF
jgi:hypothetical protein